MAARAAQMHGLGVKWGAPHMVTMRNEAAVA